MFVFVSVTVFLYCFLFSFFLVYFHPFILLLFFLLLLCVSSVYCQSYIVWFVLESFIFKNIINNVCFFF